MQLSAYARATQALSRRGVGPRGTRASGCSRRKRRSPSSSSARSRRGLVRAFCEVRGRRGRGAERAAENRHVLDAANMSRTPNAMTVITPTNWKNVPMSAPLRLLPALPSEWERCCRWPPAVSPATSSSLSASAATGGTRSTDCPTGGRCRRCSVPRGPSVVALPRGSLHAQDRRGRAAAG